MAKKEVKRGMRDYHLWKKGDKVWVVDYRDNKNINVEATVISVMMCHKDTDNSVLNMDQLYLNTQEFLQLLILRPAIVSPWHHQKLKFLFSIFLVTSLSLLSIYTII